MEPNQLHWITNFIWGIADDVLLDMKARLYKAGIANQSTTLRQAAGQASGKITRKPPSTVTSLFTSSTNAKGHNTAAMPNNYLG